MQVDKPTDAKNGLLQQVHGAYKGNANYPAWGTPKSNEYLLIANRNLDEWAHDADVRWDSLWKDYSVGPITNFAVTTYPLPVGIMALSDWVNVVMSTGEVRPFQVVHPARRNDTYTVAGTYGSIYLTGNTDGRSGNMILNFAQPLDVTYNGATIEFGGYTMPPQYVNQTDPILIDNPVWLIYATAAELARNDPSKQDQVATLVARSADAYKKMVANNQGNSSQQPNNPYGTMQQNTNPATLIYGAG